MAPLLASPLYRLCLLAALAVSIVSMYVVWEYRDRPGGTALFGFLLGVVFWTGSVLGLSLFYQHSLYPFWFKLTFLGSVVALTGLFVFGFTYTGRGNLLSRRVLALLAVEPVVLHFVIWSNPAHELFVTVSETPAGVFAYEIEFGLLFWAHSLYGYGLLTVASLLLLGTVLRAAPFYSKQALGFLVALLLPVGANILTVFGPYVLDFTPLAFTVSGLMLVGVIRTTGLAGVSPAARKEVLDNVSEGVFVIDDRNRLVNLNAAARELVGGGGERLRGKPIHQILTDYPDIDPTDVDLSESEFRLDIDGRHYRCSVSRLDGRGNRLIGRIVLVYDITETVRQREELQKQNERLDRFAEVVSHDLRNPLDIAMHSVEFELEDRESEPLERALDAHERMQAIIDDVLTLSRQGEDVIDPVDLSLETVANDAWNHVDTDDATLDVEDALVEADEGPLREVFENLFRNAVEHGGDSVTVRVSPLAGDEGFVVADDGRGFDEYTQDVFEFGHSASGGTGLGLSIVRTIVEAHGWRIRLEESDEGGACFRFENVSIDSHTSPREQLSWADQ